MIFVAQALTKYGVSGVRSLILLKKDPPPEPFTEWASLTVGAGASPQHTPLAVTGSLPPEVMLPPPVAWFAEIDVTVFVVIVGGRSSLEIVAV